MAAIRVNLEAVRSEIALTCAQCHRDPTSVSIIAVTKAQGPDVLQPLTAAGITDFGENRSEHLELMHRAAPASARFHAIGRLQSRQLRSLVEQCVCVHSLCEASHGTKLEEHCATLNKRLSVFIQVNTSGEPSKAGVSAAELPTFITVVRRQAHLDVVGLMTMAPEMPDGHADDGRIRRCFRALARLGHEHGLPRLSMGMSQDFTIAIEEGATDVRIGTRLFR